VNSTGYGPSWSYQASYAPSINQGKLNSRVRLKRKVL
jgi:hypothetical protein